MQQQPGPLGEHPRLARARRGYDPGRDSGLGHGFELVGRQQNTDWLVGAERLKHPVL